MTIWHTVIWLTAFPLEHISQAGGFLVLGVGIWTVADKSYIEVLLRNELYMTMAYVLIVAGVLVVFVSLVGCLGAVKEVRKAGRLDDSTEIG